MTVAEGGGRRAIIKKLQDVYVPALKANYMLWPAVQILNFRVVPIQFQIVSFMKSWLPLLILTNEPSPLSPLWVLLGLHTFR